MVRAGRLRARLLTLALALLALATFAAYATFNRARGGPRTPALLEVQLLWLISGLSCLLLALAALAELRVGRARLHRLETRLARLAQCTDRAADLVTIVNAKGRIEYVNPAVLSATGYERKDLIGRRAVPLLPWYPDQETFDSACAIALRGGTFNGTISCRRKDGTKFLLQENLARLEEQVTSPGRLLSTARDVTQQRGTEERLAFLASHDPVTALVNRGRFLELLEAELGRSRSGGLVLVVLDLDRFSEMNDLFASQVGDEFLRWMAGALRALAGADSIVGRLGSGEFALVCRPAAQSETDRLVRALRQRIAEGDTFAGQEIGASVCIGVARFPEDGADAGTLLSRGELALYRAKLIGRNSVQHFRPEMSEQAIERYSFERRLLGALRNAEYELHYQPYCELASGAVSGAEALIRWNSAELGMVPPSRFIPTLEDSGQMGSVGEWVVRKACRQLQDWQRRERRVRVAVNVSQLQFNDPNLVQMLTENIREHGVDPASLTVELTESVCMSDLAFAADVFKQIKAVGVSISIDDFGTGYSSLSYVRKLPLDNLKIDMSFVKEVTRDPDAASIVSAITGMARSLGLRTIAEGVESEDQRNVLRLLRCDMGQGYLFSPPVVAETLEQLVTG